MEGNKKLELRVPSSLVELDGNHAPTDPSRRQFMNQALAVSAGVALSGLVPHLKSAPLAPASLSPIPLQGAGCTVVIGQELQNPGQITPQSSQGDHKLLQAVLRVHGEDRQVSYLDVNGTAGTNAPTCNTLKLRAYEGFSGTTTDPAHRVTKVGVFNPGPTFRAAVGDTLQVAVLNHISPQEFPETANGTCDQTRSNTGTPIYPGQPPKPPCPDSPPDCFRGSNATNVHWHGTHVSPNAFSDNVLVEIVPDLKATAADCQPWFTSVACKDYPNPQAWKHLEQAAQQQLNKLFQKNLQSLEKLDAVQPEKNDATLHKRQAQQNQHLIEYDEFPQYWSGCFPYCIRPPKYVPPPPLSRTACPPYPEPKPKFVMGQAPGTHWYHAHKHGSTSIQSLNGMAGALILTDDGYDGKLRTIMPLVEEKVLVLQQFQVQPNMERTGGISGASGAPANHPGVLVNGQLQPKITMKAGEVQWWRIVNASIVGGKSQSFTCSFSTTSNAGVPKFRQIAQDGVQFKWENYQPQIQQFTPKTFFLAPGNRVDLLVQAGAAGQQATLGFGTGVPTGTDIILTVNVDTATGNYNKAWPQTEDQYPKLPDFLHDIDEVSECRTLKYQMSANGAPPMINNRKFEEGRVDEAMLLDTMQEWTIKNYSTTGNAMHPFHIHVNPFQVVEIFDPTGSIVNNVFTGIPASFGDWGKVIPEISTTKPMQLPAPWIWWDTFALPMAKDANTPGYIKFRTHFADFAGKFVNHCHILAHEDRGMMQLIEVVDNKTVVQHR
ncbi:MAG TPA: multicopper oxidase domain-containing protein [Candidatus Angelobacter sp.]